jgi:hypothetical protein
MKVRSEGCRCGGSRCCYQHKEGRLRDRDHCWVCDEGKSEGEMLMSLVRVLIALRSLS